MFLWNKTRRRKKNDDGHGSSTKKFALVLGPDQLSRRRPLRRRQTQPCRLSSEYAKQPREHEHLACCSSYDSGPQRVSHNVRPTQQPHAAMGTEDHSHANRRRALEREPGPELDLDGYRVCARSVYKLGCFQSPHQQHAAHWSLAKFH